MKSFACMLILLSWVAAGWAEEPAAIPSAVAPAVSGQMPEGTIPDASMEPKREVPLQESFAATMQLSGIYELEDGNLRVAITDKKDNSTFSLKVGETNETGMVLLDADYDREWATLEKDGLVVNLVMHGASTTEMVTPAEKEDRIHQAEERRLTYAERRKLRQQEGEKLQGVHHPAKTGEVKEQLLQEYQMEVIRKSVSPPSAQP